MAKRTRTVYDTKSIAHMWAHQETDYARNPQGNFSFRNGALYSYSTIIAMRYEFKGTVVFQHLDRTWSPTTCKHQSLARRADFGHHIYNVETFAEPGTDYANHKVNAEHFISKAQNSAALALKARKYGDSHTTDARILLDQARLYSAFMDIADRVTVPNLDLDALAADVLKRKAQESARAKAQRVEMEKRSAERKAHVAALAWGIIAHWRSTGNFNLWDETQRTYLSLSDATQALDLDTDLMRLDPESGQVVTNRGARIDARIVRAWARAVLHRMEKNDARNDSPSGLIGRHIGPFIILDVTPDALTVGCHRFNRAEIIAIADALDKSNIEPAPESAEPVRA